MTYNKARPENARYVSNTRFLASQGIPVPELLYSFPSQKTVVLEDIGDLSLEKYVRKCTPQQAQKAYKQF